jgi:hypothetical protein
MRAVKGSPATPSKSRYEKSEGLLLVSVLMPLPNRLIFSPGSVYRAWTEPEKPNRRDRPEKHSDAAIT